MDWIGLTGGYWCRHYSRDCIVWQKNMRIRSSPGCTGNGEFWNILAGHWPHCHCVSPDISEPRGHSYQVLQTERVWEEWSRNIVGKSRGTWKPDEVCGSPSGLMLVRSRLAPPGYNTLAASWRQRNLIPLHFFLSQFLGKFAHIWFDNVHSMFPQHLNLNYSGVADLSAKPTSSTSAFLCFYGKMRWSNSQHSAIIDYW